MDETQALVFFLSKAITKQKVDRYRAMIKSSHGRKKFLSGLSHKFENHINPNHIVSKLDVEIWAKPAYAYHSSSIFGEPWVSMEEAFSNIFHESIFIITQDGQAGLFIPEFPTDPVYIVV